MEVTMSNTAAVPFSGIRVLLVEADTELLKTHANLLTKNSYIVTTTTSTYTGLSMIRNGGTFDGLLVDVDVCGTDLEALLHYVLRDQPQMSIILMSMGCLTQRIPSYILESEAVLYLQIPCVNNICDIWRHICRNSVSLIKSQETQVTQTMSLEYYDATLQLEQLASDLFSDEGLVDDGYQEDLINKGKQPVMPTNTNVIQPSSEDIDENPPKRIKIFENGHVKWKGTELENMFKAALKELGEEATPTKILRHINVEGLTQKHVASHLQKYRMNKKKIEDRIAAQKERQNMRLVEPRRQQPIMRPYDLNLAGISHMSLWNIKATLEKAPPLPVPALTTPTTNQYGRSWVETDPSFWGVEQNFITVGQGSGIQNQTLHHDNMINAMQPRVMTSESSPGSGNSSVAQMQLPAFNTVDNFNTMDNVMTQQSDLGDFDLLGYIMDSVSF